MHVSVIGAGSMGHGIAQVSAMADHRVRLYDVDETRIRAIVASNTSSLSVTELASVLEDPGRCVGLHFFNPPHLVDLVEVVVAEQTRPDVERTAVE